MGQRVGLLYRPWLELARRAPQRPHGWHRQGDLRTQRVQTEASTQREGGRRAREHPLWSTPLGRTPQHRAVGRPAHLDRVRSCPARLGDVLLSTSHGSPTRLDFLFHLPAARADRRASTSSSTSSGCGLVAASERPPRRATGGDLHPPAPPPPQHNTGSRRRRGRLHRQPLFLHRLCRKSFPLGDFTENPHPRHVFL
jgi:hypothetical protein